MNRGIFYVLGAYIFWGLHPIYWKQLQTVPSHEILTHRIMWSLLFFVIVISGRKGWKELFRKVVNSKNKFLIITPALLIGSNWGVYVWAVNSGHVIETSLGYFISPLISVFLGVIFLHEKLNRIQWQAVSLAGIGVAVTTIMMGALPWISLFLAVSWGLYGLLRKQSPLNSAEGLALETGILSLPALCYFIYLIFSGAGSFGADLPTAFLLIGTGIISGLPLMIFISGSRIIDLSLAGFLQYIYPTLIFIIGYFVYNEPLNMAKLTGFIFIWIALIIYSLENRITAFRKVPAAEKEL